MLSPGTGVVAMLLSEPASLARPISYSWDGAEGEPGVKREVLEYANYCAERNDLRCRETVLENVEHSA